MGRAHSFISRLATLLTNMFLNTSAKVAFKEACSSVLHCLFGMKQQVCFRHQQVHTVQCIYTWHATPTSTSSGCVA